MSQNKETANRRNLLTRKQDADSAICTCGNHFTQCTCDRNEHAQDKDDDGREDWELYLAAMNANI